MVLPEALGVLRRMRQARLRQLRTIGFVLGGSLVRFPKHTSRYLTDKVGAKTRTVYIPLGRLKEVTQWNRSFKEARRLLAELSEIQRAVLCGEIERERRSRTTRSHNCSPRR